MSGPGDVPPELLERLRPICLGLPETHEEPAWVGIRWRIRTRTFAHLVSLDADHEIAVVPAAAADGPRCVLTFRSPGDEIDALVLSGYPFFKLSWGDDAVGMVLDDGVDWEEVAELVTDSYCLLAPKKLAALVAQPPGHFPP